MLKSASLNLWESLSHVSLAGLEFPKILANTVEKTSLTGAHDND